MRVYIAGPMTKYRDTDWNFPRFHAAAARWRQAGWEVLNPAEHFDGRTDLPYHVYIEKAIQVVGTEAEAIAMLPEWEDSDGAMLELLLAQRRGLPVFNAETMGILRVPKLRVVVTQGFDEGVIKPRYYEPPHRYAHPATQVRP